MEPSLFTKIIRGEIPSHKIYEDGATYAFLDIYPATEVDVLVIPKKQVEFIWDLEPADYQALMASVQKIGKHLRSVLGTKYVGMRVIGVDVPHAHVHVVPFNDSEELKRSQDMSKEPDHAKLAAQAEKLRLQ
ncbi:HIT family protein [Candidatus Saccharibacteria bacterium]|nr:HIT family protein [Candidatus Saccharibacteria bacterium]